MSSDDRVCLQCLKSLEGKRKDAKFCGKKCGYNFRYSVKHAEEALKTCPKCRTQFIGKTGTYCKPCQAEYARNHRHVKIGVLMDTLERIERKMDKILEMR